MMHTDLKVGMFWGELGVDYWDAATWEQQVDKYEVCDTNFFPCGCFQFPNNILAFKT